MSDQPDEFPGSEEPLADILDDIIELLGPDEPDRVTARMKADLAALGYPHDGQTQPH